MHNDRYRLAEKKYRLPYHWIRDPLHLDSLPYFGYAQVAISMLPPAPAAVFDAGCGDGRVSAEMVRRGYSVTGMDCLELPIIYSRIMVPQGSFILGDLRENLPTAYGVPEGHFDAVMAVEVYEHPPPEDCPRVLTNLYGLLRPGGCVIVSVPSKRLPYSALHYRHFDKDELTRELSEAGFEVRNIVYQHSMGRLTRVLLSRRFEAALNNKWIQPVFLKRLRRSLYMKYCNTVTGPEQCGRFIAVAER